MITNTQLVKFDCHYDKYGCLVPIEADSSKVPFLIKRVYYIFNVQDGVRRGFHSHNQLKQVLVCVSGSVKILVKTPYEEEVVLLDDPQTGLYIGPMVWREMYDFSKDAVLLVLASEHYNVSDYIREYPVYEMIARKYFESRN